jgi:hypothetical protein
MTHWCHIGPHVSLAWDENFLDETQNGAKMGFKPMTTWSSKVFTTRLLLRLCCYASYYFFVLCFVVLIWSSQHGNDPLVSSSCTESNRTHLPVLVALKLILFKAKY